MGLACVLLRHWAVHIVQGYESLSPYMVVLWQRRALCLHAATQADIAGLPVMAA